MGSIERLEEPAERQASRRYARRMNHDDPRLPRRDLLTLAAAGALVLGLDRLALADDDGWEQPAWDAALRSMQATKRHGVIVIVPPDAAGRRKVAEALARRIPIVQGFGGGLDPLGPWFVECVWVCASAQRAQAQPGETLVLVDPKGKRVAGAAVSLDDAGAFARGVEALLTGEGRLDGRAKAASAEVKRRVADLQTAKDHDEPEAAANARQWLFAHIEEAASALVQAWRAAGPEAKRQLESLLQHGCAARAGASEGLPFGIRWKVARTEPEPCPPCGMARPTVDGRTFLEFWGK